MTTTSTINTTETIWNEFHSQLHRFIQNRVSEASMADDILQDVFLRIHSRIDSLRDNNKIQSWIYQITRNAIIDFYRTNRPMAELPAALVSDEKDKIDKARDEIGQNCMTPLINELEEPYRQSVMMSEIEGAKQKEVADKEGISLSGAKSRIQRGRSMIKDMLLKCCHFEFDHQGKMVEYEGKNTGCSQCQTDCN